jgi:hypothetical protein
MIPGVNTMRHHPFSLLICFVSVYLSVSLPSCTRARPSGPEPPGARHELRIELKPEENRLIGRDEILLTGWRASEVTLFLAPHAVVKTFTLNGRSRKQIFRNGEMTIPLEAEETGKDLRLIIEYEGIFQDPVPENPVNMDNPGFGVSGTVSPRGVLLLGGSGWYPRIPGAVPGYRLEVAAPEPMKAITAGKSLGFETRNGKTLSIWQIDDPVDFLALSAGPFRVREKSVAGATIATYFFPESEDLSPRYLEASARYIALYADLFGPYPFDKFAVVENFFPTGYGFPSYTLLGSQVIRLPFIIHTSLGHEIAHCWWGNGVRVDSAGGNWSEGLTTYISDYLYHERESSAAAREYRIQMLRNYAALVEPGDDIPLSRFMGRIDPVTKAVGYDKGAMVFHMLRRRVGDDLFREGLHRIYTENLFKKISWREFRLTYEAMAEVSFADFFDQWVERKGAPRLSLAEVTVDRMEAGFRIRGRIDQEAPVYDLQIPLSVETRKGRVLKTVHSNRASTRFDMTVEDFPSTLTLDPDADLFRRLHPSEIPPSVNSLKGADSVLVILAEGGSPETADLMIRSLGLNRARIIEEGDLTEQLAGENDLVFVGLPRNRSFLKELPETVSIRENGFVLNDRVYDVSSDAFFGVFAHPRTEKRVAALFMAKGPSAETVARKITHYGKYGYLSFSGDVNVDKGTWPVTDSPVIHHFHEPASRENPFQGFEPEKFSLSMNRSGGE